MIVALTRQTPLAGETVPIAIQRLGLAGAMAAASLLALELGARALPELDSDLPEEALWTPEGEGFSPPPNTRGHREEELDAAALEGRTRILFLGDSFTFGHGVLDGSLRFTDRVETALQERGEPVHVYNAGVNGANPTEWLETLQAQWPEYQPDVVVGVFFLRCGTSLSTSFLLYERELKAIQKRYQGSPLHSRSALYRRWAERQVRRDFTEFYVGQMRAAYLGTPEQTERWRQEQEALRAIQAFLRERGTELKLVIFPMLYSLDDYPFDGVEAEIARATAEAGIPTESLTPTFHNREASELWVSPIDQHPNAAGHAIAAEALLPWVTDWLDE